MYRAEAVIPIEISLCSARVLDFSSIENEELMSKQLDSLEEHWEVATIRLANYEQKLVRWYNKDVKIRDFMVNDLVLRKVVGSARDINVEK